MSALWYPRVVNSASGSMGQDTFTHRSRVDGSVIKFFALRGLIRVVNEMTGECKIVGLKDFLLRAKAINDSINPQMHRDEKADTHRLVECMIAVAKKAKEQGDPAQILRERYQPRIEVLPAMPGHDLPIEDPAAFCARPIR